MTVEQLHDALTLLPADLVAAADRRRSRKTAVIHWQRWAAMAACFTILLCAGSFWMLILTPKGSSMETAADMEMMAAEAAPAEAAQAEEPAAAAPAERENSSVTGTGRLTLPPDLRLESGSQSLTIAAAGYTWEVLQEDGTTMALSADIPAPTDFPGRHPVLESETEAADLTWEIQPLSVTARCWHEEDLRTEKPVEMNGTILPFYRGAHIYEITAQWENGTATYVLRVNTRR